MHKPTVTIVIPTYNRASTVARAVESVFNQSYQEFELIVVDDGSTDNTRQVITSYLRRYSQKLFYIYQPHKNVSAARNAGIRNARGDYIAFLDSDDEWYPQKLERQIDYIQCRDIGLVHTNRDLECLPGNNRNEIVPVMPQLLARSSREMLGGHAYLAMTVLVRKSVLDEVGMFDETLPTTQDMDLWLRIAKKFDIAFIDESLMKSRKLCDSLMASDPELKYSNLMTVYQKMLLDNHTLINKSMWRRRYIATCYALAAERYAKGEKYGCVRCITRALFLNPLVGRTFIQQADSGPGKLGKVLKPYRILGGSLMRRMQAAIES